MMEYVYQVVQCMPGGQTVRWIDVDSLDRGIAEAKAFMAEAVPGEPAGRWAAVERRMQHSFFDPWVECWNADGDHGT